MSEHKLQHLKEQRTEIRQLLTLFERAAFSPMDHGGDPTAAFNAIYETRIALQTKGAAYLSDDEAATFFKNLQIALRRIENIVQEKYPQVVDLSIKWRQTPIDKQYRRKEDLRNALGGTYDEAAGFIRQEIFHNEVYMAPLKGREILKKLDKEIDNLLITQDKIAPHKFTILFLAADPTDTVRLRLGEEFREIDEQLTLAKQREYFDLALPQLSLRPKDIARVLLNAQPQIVHFSGHGTNEGALCLENEIGQRHLVNPAALSALFEQFSSQVDCVLLNACYSEIQAKAISEHIKYVIGMNQVIGDKAAIAFAIGFYQALGAGRTIEDAYKLGCVQIMLQGIPEHLTPVLIKNGQIQKSAAA